MLRLGPLRTKTVFKRDTFRPRARRAEVSIVAGTPYEKSGKGRNARLSRSFATYEGCRSPSAGRGLAGGPGRGKLLGQHVHSLSAEHHLVADHVGRGARDRQLVGQVVGLAEDVVDRRVLHRLAQPGLVGA